MRLANFHVIGDVDARGSHPLNFFWTLSLAIFASLRSFTVPRTLSTEPLKRLFQIMGLESLPEIHPLEQWFITPVLGPHQSSKARVRHESTVSERAPKAALRNPPLTREPASESQKASGWLEAGEAALVGWLALLFAESLKVHGDRIGNPLAIRYAPWFAMAFQAVAVCQEKQMILADAFQ